MWAGKKKKREREKREKKRQYREINRGKQNDYRSSD